MLKFRKDINGLRALAVISVVLYHFNVPFFSGGFSGVDIFFVISGFLMTGIIFSKLEKNDFSLIGFYVDRAKRIIPALSFTCILVFLACWFFLTPTDFETVGRHIYSSLLFISNIVYFQEINYFDASASQKWLLHTWSLSVEWQFYLILPLIISIIFKVNKKLLKPLLYITLILSFAWSIYLTETGNNSEAFYLLPSRAWEMILGGLVYLSNIKLNNRNKVILHYSSVLGMILGVICLTKYNQWPGSLALIPVISAAVFIAANHESKLFCNGISQFVGKISYSVYLCHWPVVVAIGYFGFSGVLIQIIGVLCSFALGTVSFYLIEDPARKYIKKLDSHTYKEIAIIIAIIVIPFSLAIYSAQNGGIASRFPYSLMTSKEIAQERARYWVDGDKEKPVPVSGTKKIVIIGNSHAVDLTYALTESGMKGDYTFIKTSSYCSNFGLTPNVPQYGQKCIKYFNDAINKKSLKDADVIFLHDDWAKEDLSELKKSLEIYRSKTKAQIYVIGPKMSFTTSAINVVANAMSHKQTTVKMINSYAKKYYFDEKIKTNKDLYMMLSDLSFKENNINYISAMDIQCGTSFNCELISEKNKSFYYFDAGHFTLNGAINFGEKLKSTHPELYQY